MSPGWGVVLDVAAALLLGAGVLLSLLAGLGSVRFPDVLTRMHAQAKPAVLGVLLVLAGVALAERSAGLTATLTLVAALQLITAPAGSTLIGRSAWMRGHHDVTRTLRDDLADRQDP